MIDTHTTFAVSIWCVISHTPQFFIPVSQTPSISGKLSWNFSKLMHGSRCSSLGLICNRLEVLIFFPSSSFTWFCFYCQLEVLHNPKYLWKFKLKYLSLQVGEVKIYYIFSVVVRLRILFRYVNLCIFMEISDIHKIKRNIWKHFLLKWRRIIK